MTVASDILSPETGGFSGKPHSHGAVPLPGDSRGQRATSFSLADFPVPVGREEEWRFTPLDRLRHLHEDDAPGEGTVHVDVDAAPEVEVETVARGRPTPRPRRRAGRPGRRAGLERLREGHRGHGAQGRRGEPADDRLGPR